MTAKKLVPLVMAAGVALFGSTRANATVINETFTLDGKDATNIFNGAPDPKDELLSFSLSFDPTVAVGTPSTTGLSLISTNLTPSSQPLSFTFNPTNGVLDVGTYNVVGENFSLQSPGYDTSIGLTFNTAGTAVTGTDYLLGRDYQSAGVLDLTTTGTVNATANSTGGNGGANVPEPTSAILLLTGLSGLSGLQLYRRRRSATPSGVAAGPSA